MTEPHAFLVIFGDRLQHECALLDRAHAEGYAAQAHGVCMPLRLSAEDEAALRERRDAVRAVADRL